MGYTEDAYDYFAEQFGNIFERYITNIQIYDIVEYATTEDYAELEMYLISEFGIHPDEVELRKIIDWSEFTWKLLNQEI